MIHLQVGKPGHPTSHVHLQAPATRRRPTAPADHPRGAEPATSPQPGAQPPSCRTRSATPASTPHPADHSSPRSFERSESIRPPAARSADALRTTMKAWRKTGQVRAGGWGTHSGLCLAWLEPSLKRRTSRYFYRGWKIDVSPGQVGYRLCHFLPGTLTSYGQPYG